MDDGNDSVAYCLPGANEFQHVYIKMHGFIALIICFFGSIANSVNIAVLSRKEMISSTNSILTGLAVADLLVMVEYIPFALHVYVPTGSDLNKNTYGWAVFVYFHSIFSQTFHTISIWLTVTLAVWRYIAIKYPQKNKTLCSERNTTIAISSSYVICPILCLPIYFAMEIHPLNSVTPGNETSLTNVNVEEQSYAVMMAENHILLTTIFWIYSVILKLIPCIVLSVLSVCLILKMKASEKRRQKLLNKSAIVANDGEKTRLHDDGCKKTGGRTDRTTRMLLALLGLFLATEVPQGLFGLVSAIAPHFFESCYRAFGEVMDMMALVGSAINFAIYCSMSRQFRSTFGRLARALLPTRPRLKGGPPK